MKSAVDRLERDIGPIDILVNNAGMQFRAPLDVFPSDKHPLLRTNISSACFTSASRSQRT